MNINDHIAEFIKAEPSDSTSKRVFAILLPRATLASAMTLATAHLLSAGDAPPIAVIANAVENAAKITHINPAVAASIALLTYGGERTIMSILEQLLKPIIASSEARGEARGQARGEEQATASANRRWRAWLARRDAARDQGLPFDEPPPDHEPAE